MDEIANNSGLSKFQTRLWLFSAPFIGLGLALAGIHPHDPLRYTSGFTEYSICAIYLLPLLLPLKRFCLIPLTTLLLSAVTLLLYDPIFLAARDETSLVAGFAKYYLEAEFLRSFGTALIELLIPFFLLFVKLLFVEWLEEFKTKRCNRRAASSSPSSSDSAQSRP